MLIISVALENNAACSGTSIALRSKICLNCSHAALVVLSTATGCLRGAVTLVPLLLFSREYGLGCISPNFRNFLLQTTCSLSVGLKARGPIVGSGQPPRASACARCCTSHFTLRYFFFSTHRIPATCAVRIQSNECDEVMYVILVF